MPLHFPLSRIAAWLNVGLVLLLSYSLAQLSWQLLQGAAPSHPVTVPEAPSVEGMRVTQTGLEQIAALHLMGSPSVQPAAEKPIEAPKTRLNLVLKGVFAGDGEGPDSAFAIIASNGREEQSYRIGDVIGGAARLHRIYPDRVLLQRGERLETLALPDDKIDVGDGPSTAPAGRNGGRNPADSGAAAAPVRNLSGVREQLLTEPQEALALIRAQPVMEAGSMKGYRVNPGKNRALFARAGLRPGDVVTAVNGIELSNPAQLQQIYQQLRNGGRFNLAVERGGRPLTLSVQLD